MPHNKVYIISVMVSIVNLSGSKIIRGDAPVGMPVRGYHDYIN